MISITLEQLVNSSEALKALSNKPLKARSAYAVARILKAADQEMTNFNDTRMELIKKYGVKDETGELKLDDNGNAQIDHDSLSTFNTEFRELLQSQIEINANKIKIGDLGDIDFTPSEMAQLEDFIEFEE